MARRYGLTEEEKRALQSSRGSGSTENSGSARQHGGNGYYNRQTHQMEYGLTDDQRAYLDNTRSDARIAEIQQWRQAAAWDNTPYREAVARTQGTRQTISDLAGEYNTLMRGSGSTQERGRKARSMLERVLEAKKDATGTAAKNLEEMEKNLQGLISGERASYIQRNALRNMPRSATGTAGEQENDAQWQAAVAQNPELAARWARMDADAYDQKAAEAQKDIAPRYNRFGVDTNYLGADAGAYAEQQRLAARYTRQAQYAQEMYDQAEQAVKTQRLAEMEKSLPQRPQTYTAENVGDYLDRARYLAELTSWTQEQREEAKEIREALAAPAWKDSYISREAKIAAAEGRAPDLELSQLASDLDAGLHPVIQSGVGSFLRGTGALSAAETVGNVLGDDTMRAQLSGFERRAALAADQGGTAGKIAQTLGGTAGSLALMGTAGELIGSAAPRIAGFSKLPVMLQNGAKTAMTFALTDAVKNTGALSAGRMTAGEYLSDAARSGVSGAAGSLASGMVSSGIARTLAKHDLMTPFMEYVRNLSSSMTFAAAQIGTDYAMTAEENRPSGQEMAEQLLTSFLFSAINSGIETARTTQANKAAVEQAVRNLQEEYARLSQSGSAPQEIRAAGERILRYSEEVRGAISQHYYAGQQKSIDEVRAALDMIDSRVNGILSGTVDTAAGNRLGGAAWDAAVPVGEALPDVPTGGSTGTPTVYQGSGTPEGTPESAQVRAQLQGAIAQGVQDAARQQEADSLYQEFGETARGGLSETRSAEEQGAELQREFGEVYRENRAAEQRAAERPAAAQKNGAEAAAAQRLQRQQRAAETPETAQETAREKTRPVRRAAEERGAQEQQRAPARQRTAYVRPSNGTAVAGTDILRVERSGEGGMQLVRTDGSTTTLDAAKTAGTALEVLEAAKQLPEHSDPLTLNGMLRAYEGYLAGKPSNTETAETFFDGYTTALYAGIEGESRSVLSEITEDSAMQRAMADGYSRGVEIAQGQALAGQLGSAGAAALEEYGYRYAEQFGAFYQAGQEGLSFRDAQRMTNMLTMGESRKAEMQAAFEAGRKDGTEYETYKDDLGFEEDRGGGEQVSLDSSERAAGVGAGEPAGELGEGAERAAVSAKALGLENGTDRKTARVLRATELTEEMWGIKRDAKKHGMDVQFIEGYMEIRAGNRVLRARGAKIGNQLIVQTDNLSASFYEVYRHERLHGQIASGEIQLEKAIRLVRETIGEGKFEELLPGYRKAYAGVYSGSRFEQNVQEELCADAAAGLIPGAKAVDLSRIEEGQKNSAPAERGASALLSVQTAPDGTKYTKIDASEIKAEEIADGDSIGKKARIYLRQHFRGVVLPVGKTKKAFIRSDGINEYTNPAKHLSEQDYNSKMLAATELDNMLKSSTYLRWEKDSGHHPEAVRGWNYYRTIFTVGDGASMRVYSGEVQIMRIARGDVFHDITKIKDVTDSTMGQDIKAHAQSVGNASENTVAQDKGKSQEGKTSIDVSARDKTYLSAVESGDMETAQKMVEEAAKAAGYDSPMLYHGTKTFGFTEFDLAKMDDKRSIFATSKQEVAQTYSGAPGTRRISETARNIEAMNPKETVDALNDYAKRYGDGLDSKYTFITPEEAAKISSNADAALNELSALVREKIAEYAERMAADFNEKDMKTQEQLVGLQEKLYLGDRYSILTPLYLLINHTDAFSGSKAAADALQKLTIEREVKKRSLDTSNGFVLRDELGGYIYVPMTTEAAKDILRDYGSRGNYALVAKTGRTLEVNAAGQRWNELRNWTKGAEYDVKDTFIDKEGDRVYLLDRNTDDVITSTDLSGVKETLSDTSLHMLLLNKANSAMRVEAETIRDTRGISAWAARNGYDSVIFRNLIDSGGNADFESADTPSDVYIIFDPASVKSADPVTYDDSGNVIPLSERFNPRKRDIRYSVSEEAEPTSSAEYAQMQSGRTAAVQAQEQKKRQETLYSHMMERSFELGRQFTEGTQKDVNTDDLPGIAADILRFAGKNAMSRTELEQRLEDIAMKAAREYSPMEAYETAKAEADALAADMIRNALAADATRGIGGQTAEMSETWDALKKTMRSATTIRKDGKQTTNPVKLAISGQNREDLSSAGGYESMRKRLMGYAFLSPSGTPVEEFYQKQLSPKFPEYFPASIQNPADQLIRIVDVLDRFRQIFKSPYMGALAEDTAMLSQEIVQRLYNSNVAEPGAEAFTMQHEDMLRAHYENKLAEARTQMQQEVDSLRQLYENNRTARQEQKDRDALLKIAQRLDRVKVGSAWKAKAAELVGNLDTIAKSMTGRTIIGDRIGNLSSEGIETVREDDLGRRYVDIETLKDWVKEMQAQNPDFMPDQRTMDKIDRLNKVQIADMDIGDVRALLNAMQNLENEMRTSKKLLDAQDRRDVAVQTAEVISDIESSKGVPATGVKAAWTRHVTNEGLSPVRFLHRVTGYNDADPLYRAAQALQKGQTAMHDYTRRAEAMFRGFMEDKAFMASLGGKKARVIEITGLGENGKAETVKITPDMQIAIFLHSFNNDNVRHAERGGFVVPDYELLRKGKVSEAYEQGKLLRMRRSQMRAVQENMTEREIQFARAVYRYFNTMSKNEINEVSRKLLGYDIAGVKNYYPIETNRDFGSGDPETVKRDGTIEGMGFMKSRQGAAGPINLRGAVDTLTKSIDRHGKYVGLAIPVRNFGKLYGNTTWQVMPTEEQGALPTQNAAPRSLKRILNRKWGSGASAYIDKLMADIQNPSKNFDSWARTMAKVRSNYAGSVLTMNASVAVKQAASYPTAAAVVGWGPLIKAMTDWKKSDINFIAEHTPLLWYRSKGFSTQELGDMAKGQKQIPKGLNWIQGIDVATVKKLWKAAEYYVRQEQPKLEVRSDAYWDAVTEVYERIVLETQPNYTTMERPQLLRSENTLLQNLAMFKTQPFQNFNIAYDALANLQAKERQLKAAQDAARTDSSEETQARLREAKQNLKNAKKGAARGVSALVISAGVFSAMTLLWNIIRGNIKRYRDDDKNEINLKTIGEAFVSKTFLSDTVGSLAGVLPFGSDAYEVFASLVLGEQYYGMEALTPSAFSDFLEQVVKLDDTISDVVKAIKGDSHAMDSLLAVNKIGTTASKLFGAPVENVENLMKAAAFWVMQPFMSKEESSYWYRYYTQKTTAQGRSSADKSDIYAAYRSGNTDGYQSMRDAMKEWVWQENEQYKSGEITRAEAQEKAETSMNNAMAAQIKDEYMTGGITDTEAADLLQKIGGKDKDKAAEAVAKWHFQRDGGGKDASAAQASAYYEFAQPAGISMETFKEAWDFHNNVEADKDSSGKSVPGSAKQKVVDYIRSLGLSKTAERALWNALKGTWSDKDTPWA